MSRRLRIDVHFDFICPWCLIGKRQLERTLNMLHGDHPDIRIDISWHGIQLLPDLPAQGMPFGEFYRRRLGSDAAVRLRQMQVQQAAAAAGVMIDLSRIEKMPNTATAHRLFNAAAALGTTVQRDALLERLFRAYFDLGKDLSDSDTLRSIARDCGFAVADIETALQGQPGPFIAATADARVTGVPFFVFNQECRVSGAQPVDVLEGAIYRTLALTSAGE